MRKNQKTPPICTLGEQNRRKSWLPRSRGVRGDHEHEDLRLAQYTPSSGRYRILGSARRGALGTSIHAIGSVIDLLPSFISELNPMGRTVSQIVLCESAG